VKFEATVGGRQMRVEVQGTAPAFVVTLDGRRLEVEARDTAAGFVSLRVDGKCHEAGLLPRPDGSTVLLGGRVYEVTLTDDAGVAITRRSGASGPARVTAPMPGRIVRVLVQTGDVVAEGQGLVVMEAMKMENELRAPRAGRVKELPAREQQAVDTGALLVVVE
jgi:biotin carboxyl carrier protein